MKRTLAMLLAVLTLLTLLVGCSSKPADTTSSATTVNTDSTPADSTTPADDIAEPADVTEPADDVTEPDDNTVTAASDAIDMATYFPLSEQKTYTIFSSNGNDVNDANDMLMFQKAEELTNIHIDWTLESSQSVQEKFALNIVSGIWEDAYMSNYWSGYGGVEGALEDDIIIDMKDLIPTYAPDYLEIANGDEDYRRRLVTDSGAMPYFMTIMYSHLENEYQDQPSYMGYMVREDYLNNVGLTSTDIVTIDDWSNMLKLLHDNGYGTTATMTIFDVAESRIMAAWDICNGFFQIDGELHYGLVEDSFKEYLRTVNGWYEAGYLGTDFLSNTGWGGLMDPAKYNGGYAVFIGGHNDVIDFYNITDDPNAQIRGLAHPVLEEGQTQKINHLMNGGIGVSGTNITTTCEDPEDLIAWFNFWYTEEGSLLRNWGVEGITFTWKDGYDLPYFSDEILHNETGVTTARRTYIDWTTMPGCYEWKEGWSSEAPEYEWYCAEQIWDGNLTDEYTMPTITMTPDEQAEYGELYTDIQTYTAEMTAKFLVGELDIDADWDNYINTLYGSEFNLGDLMEVYQGALDRYYAK